MAKGMKNYRVDSARWESHGHKVGFDSDATGYFWYYLDNMQSPLEPNMVPQWLISESKERYLNRPKVIKI